MEIIVIANLKGGAGKTSTAAALWYWLNQHGKPALGIDLDSQANFTYTAKATVQDNIMDILQGADINTAIQETAGGDIIPASYSLNSADITLTGKGKALALKKALAKLSKHYDYVVIDTEPHIGLLTINALTAAHKVIIPTQADIFSLQGISQLWRNIQDIKRMGANPSLSVDGILITRYSNRATLSKEIKESLESIACKMGTRLYKTTIRESISVKEAQIGQKSLFAITPRSKAAQDYEAFIAEVLQDN